MLALVLFLICTSMYTSYGDPHWHAWREKFGRTYGDDKERYDIWLKNKNMIEAHNKRYEAGLETYDMALNEFSDYTEEEFTAMLSPPRETRSVSTAAASSSIANVHKHSPLARVAPPDKKDWRISKYVTPVMNQGYRCYAFAAVEAIEALHKNTSGALTPLSYRQVLNCNEDACGQSITALFDYVKKAGGLQSDKDYPYTGTTQSKSTCKFDKTKVVATVGGYKVLAQGDEDELKQVVGQILPVSARIHATGGFSGYRSGIFQDYTCSKVDQNHGVLIVGYGRASNMDYWILKNSWGTRWGESGYMRMRRNAANMCGIATHATYPVNGGKRHLSTELAFLTSLLATRWMYSAE